MRLLAIDPGNTESAYVVIDGTTREPITYGKITNHDLLDLIYTKAVPLGRDAVVEMVASYGMAVGAEVFETCVWIGRFQEALEATARNVELVKRQPVKLHHCHDARAKDANVRQA